MSKKLMLLAAGVLAALAFSALPSVASAEEAKLKCEGAGPCTYEVSGGESRFSLTNGDTVWCSSVSGNGEMTNLNAEREATTGNVRLLFHGCKEQSTIFHFSCSNTATAGTVTTNLMVTHNVKLPGTTNGQGVLMTGANTTFECAGGFAATTVTGNVIGELDQSCGVTGTTVKTNFTAGSHGNQTLKSYTSTIYDLIGKTNHTNPESSYLTAAQTGTGTLTFNQNVVPTC